MNTHRPSLSWLFLGDTLTIFVVTMIGFLSHYHAIQDWRWLTTFVPVTLAWFVVAPWLGVYRRDITCSRRQIWRIGLAAFLSGPMAAWLRGVMLNSAIIPVFVLVLSLTNALGLLIWRFIWTFIEQRISSHE